MSPLRESDRFRATRVAALIGFLTLEMVATSCAGSDKEIGARADDTDGEVVSDVRADANDATCEVDSDFCANAQERDCIGFEWCTVKTNHPASLGMSSIWGSGPNDVWIVGAAGSVSHWDGKEWTFASLPTKQSLQAIWGTGANDVWTVSTPDAIFHTTRFVDGTARWSSVTSIGQGLYGGFLSAIWGTSPSDIWVAGDHRVHVDEYGWRTVVMDGGLAWAPTIIAPMGSHEIKSIWGTGPEDIWLVGSKENPLRSFAAHTNGVGAAGGGVPVWTEFDTQSFCRLYAVWGSGPDDVWSVGDGGTIRHFTAGAAVWSVVESPTTEGLRGLWGAGPNDIWAVGEHGTILHYDGKAWTTSTGAFPAGEKPSLHGVWGSGPADVWAVGHGIVMHFAGAKPSAQGGNP